MKRHYSILALGAACLATAVPAGAQAPAASEPPAFVAAGMAFSACLKRNVQMGMTTKMDPVAFKKSFAESCKAEEARFRVEGVREAVRQGRTQVQAAREIDGNIANGRRIFAADQESYVKTGKVPR